MLPGFTQRDKERGGERGGADIMHSSFAGEVGGCTEAIMVVSYDGKETWDEIAEVGGGREACAGG